MGPLGEAQQWGLPEKPSIVEQRTWDTQQRFLRRYAERGKFVLSAADVGISIQAIYKWQRSDKFSFNKRMELAYQAYRESQEEENEEWVRESKQNTQIYRIFHMKAIWPEKYREEVKVVGMEPVRDMLDRLTEMAAKRLEAEAKAKALEEGGVEVQYRDLDGGQEEGDHA